MTRFVIAIAVLWAVVAATKPGTDTTPVATETTETRQVFAENPASPTTTPIPPSAPVGSYVPLVDAEAPFVDLFIDCGQKHGIDPALLAGVAAVESTFRVAPPDSPKGAQGLMQFIPATASAMGVDPWDPASAICGTARYLATSYEIHGTWDLAIAAYNAGDPNVISRGVAAADGSYVADVQAEWAARQTTDNTVIEST